MSELSQIDADSYARLVVLVRRLVGIDLGTSKQSLATTRLLPRLRATSCRDFSGYLDLVESVAGAGEVVHMVDALSTNVTSFWREGHHFRMLDGWVRAWVASGQESFRLWCAASSSGEEVWGMAAILAEALGTGLDWRILGTDISTRMLERARSGSYPELGGMPPVYQRWFTHAAGIWQVDPRLAQRCVFNRLNLNRPPFPMHGPLDVVFCRNVMIYFDVEVRQALLLEIDRLLRPGGYLCVGHAESLAGQLPGWSIAGPAAWRKPG